MNFQSNRLPIKTRKAIKAYLVDFSPSCARAQLINIYGYQLEEEESIADRFLRDHVSHCHAFRQAFLLVDAGAATVETVKKTVHCGNGVFKEVEIGCKVVFEDGSKL